MRDFSNLQHPEQEYKKFLAEGKFMLQRSRDSGKFFFYPRIAEPVTGSTNLEWAAPSGLGTVYAVTVVRAKPPAPNYNVVLVDLAEGPRMMSRVEGIAPEAVKIGMKVKARVIRQGEEGVVVFDPA
jgi:uncharacterized OB-fold protein